MHHLVVHRQLAAAIGDDQDPHAATTVGKDVVQLVPEPTLVDHGQTLLDVTRLGHGDNATVVTDVQHAVLLEDRTQHVLHHHRGRGMRDEARLLVQLLREQIDAQVAVLARLARNRDADDLARTALQDQQIPDADVVARDGDGVGWSAALHHPHVLPHGARGTMRMMMVVIVEVDLLAHGAAVMMRMQQPIRGLLDPVTERVVVPVVVVVAHLGSRLFRNLYGRVVDVDGGAWRMMVVLLVDEVVLKLFRWRSLNSVTILALGHVDLRFGPMGSRVMTIDPDVRLRVVMSMMGLAVNLDVRLRVVVSMMGLSVDLDVRFRVVVVMPMRSAMLVMASVHPSANCSHLA